jgi:hypothetical protein
VLGGSAVFEAANALLAKIRAAAGARLGCADDPLHTVGQLGGAERPNVLLLPAPVAGGGRGCMLSLFVVWDAAAVAFRVSAGFGAAWSIVFLAASGARRPTAISSIARIVDATRSISTPAGAATDWTASAASFLRPQERPLIGPRARHLRCRPQVVIRPSAV